MRIFDQAVAGIVPWLPRGLVGVVAKRYIAGETLDSVAGEVARLNQSGMRATVDILGENITRFEETAAAVSLYLDVLARLEADGLEGNISIKPTHLGLSLDPEGCHENVRRLVVEAAKTGRTLRIDMEDSPTTTATIDLYRALRAEGHENVGIVLQACLFRSEADARALAELGASVRVCKGIYREPADIAWHDRDDIRKSFLRLVDIFLGHGCRVAIATHDSALVDGAYRLLERNGGSEGSYEFQMLLGVTEKLRRSILEAGHPMTVYVPFGAEWFAYSVRRLRENPAIAGHVFRALIGLG